MCCTTTLHLYFPIGNFLPLFSLASLESFVNRNEQILESLRSWYKSQCFNTWYIPCWQMYQLPPCFRWHFVFNRLVSVGFKENLVTRWTYLQTLSLAEYECLKHTKKKSFPLELHHYAVLDTLAALLRSQENKAGQNAQSSSSGSFRIRQIVNSKNTYQIHTSLSRNTMESKQREAKS